MTHRVLEMLKERRARQQKSFAILIDPDKVDKDSCMNLVKLSNQAKPDFFLIGGSLITSDKLEMVVNILKSNSDIPTILFPGSNVHVSQSADALLFLCLISGRNPEYLIGQHVVAAPMLKKSNLEIISTGYMLVNCGNQTTVSYISNTTPIPYEKPEIAAATAMAGEMLGMKVMYLDGGSGAQKPIGPHTISYVRKSVNTPIIVGGGIRSEAQAQTAFEAGADVIVIGNAIEENPDLLTRICECTHSFNASMAK